jgi:hypothetical protein
VVLHHKAGAPSTTFANTVAAMAYMHEDFSDEYIEPKHSGIGIASFVLSCIAALGMFIVIGYAAVVVSSHPEGLDNKSPQAVVIGLAFIGMGFADLLAVGLGIAGMVQSNRKKLFAILGTIISVGTIAIVTALVIIGSSME